MRFYIFLLAVLVDSALSRSQTIDCKIEKFQKHINDNEECRDAVSILGAFPESRSTTEKVKKYFEGSSFQATSSPSLEYPACDKNRNVNVTEVSGSAIITLTFPRGRQGHFTYSDMANRIKERLRDDANMKKRGKTPFCLGCMPGPKSILTCVITYDPRKARGRRRLPTPTGGLRRKEHQHQHQQHRHSVSQHTADERSASTADRNGGRQSSEPGSPRGSQLEHRPSAGPSPTDAEATLHSHAVASPETEQKSLEPERVPEPLEKDKAPQRSPTEDDDQHLTLTEKMNGVGEQDPGTSCEEGSQSSTCKKKSSDSLPPTQGQ
ncbi:unnamed protein product [Cylicocyclus nassatus]|uniref:Uncharacterized protein n=1 Tax=Cylicocyclus nassatus TaxID=53992 RepID=A0AA36MCB1_CYLNA|nr:unnamed protein product [Cylicocyclus nassatus]